MKPEKKQRLTADLKKLATHIRRTAPPKAGLRTHFLFWIFSKLHVAGWDSSPTERAYWVQQGWISS